jgi:hypothetical protein
MAELVAFRRHGFSNRPQRLSLSSARIAKATAAPLASSPRRWAKAGEGQHSASLCFVRPADLADMEKNKGGRPREKPVNSGAQVFGPPTLADLGVTIDSGQYQKLAALPAASLRSASPRRAGA